LSVILIFEIVTPVFTLGIEIIKLKLSLVKLVFYMPTMSLVKLTLLIKDGFIGIFLIIKEIINGIKAIKTIIIPAAKTVSENKDTTLSII